MKKWSALRAWPAHRQAIEHAIVAAACKLACVLHRMWLDETDFNVDFGATVTQRLRLKPAR